MKYTPGCDLKQFVSEMTLEQKIKLQALLTDITGEAIPELGIPAMCVADGVTGISFLQAYLDRLQRIQNDPDAPDKYPDYEYTCKNSNKVMDEILIDTEAAYKNSTPGTVKYAIAKELHDMKPNGLEPTCFPSGVVLGSTWNPELVYKCGRLQGAEMNAFGVDVVLGPNVDIQRDPLGGRAYECYSEDPLIVADMAAAFINGMQTEGVAACAKHFAVNNQETRRNSADSVVSERALHEVYFRGYESAVKRAKTKSIMMSYNKVNGTHSAESAWLMKDILRDLWGYEGCVVSDWGAARNEPLSTRNGLDLILPGRRMDIKAEIEKGEMTEADLDRACYRIMQMYETLAGFTGRDVSKYSDKEAMQCVYDCTVDGAILLKNENVLPLDIGTPTAFWGKRSKKLIECGGGSTQVFTNKTSSVLERSKLVNGEENCTFEELTDGTKALVYTVAYPGHESADNPSLLIEHDDRMKIVSVLKNARDKGIKTVVVLNTSGPVYMRAWQDLADAILCVYIPGCEGGNAIADMIYGKAAPAGRLAQTFPVQYEDAPSAINFIGENHVVYYGEEVFVGYKWYDFRRTAPAYPFGFGLTYTDFEISAKTDELHLTAGGEVEFPVTVKNIGKRAGAEVVQVYVHQERPSFKRPVRELAAYKKVYLEPGEETTVTFKLDDNAVRYYCSEKHGWVVEPDKYTVYVGRSSRDFAAEIPMTVTGPKPFGYGQKTTINDIAANEEAVALVCTIVPDFRERLPQLLKDFDGETLLDVYDFIMDEYYLNPIHAMGLFGGLCYKLAQIKD